MLENAVLVTGAGRRIGYHIAQRLQQDGYSVIAHYRTHNDKIQALIDLGVNTLCADFTDPEAILAFIDTVKKRATSLRGLIHNASAFAPTSPDLASAAQQYQQFFLIHMMTPYLLNQGLQPLLQNSSGDLADIIHITDINVDNPTPQFDIYGTTKAGLHNMMRVLAKKFAPTIKVNAVAPGPVLFAEQHSTQIQQQILAETPLAKEGGAEPIYLAVQSLLTNPFITGVSLAVDGGRRLSKR